MRRPWVLFVAAMLAATLLPSTAAGRAPVGLHLVAQPTPARHMPNVSARLLDLLATRATLPAAPLAGAGDVDVSVTLAGDSVPTGLGALGVTVYGHRGRLLEARIPATALASLARLPGVALVEPLQRQWTPDVTSQGVGIIGADQWQAAGITGAGVKIGVIDGGFGGIASLIGTEIGGGTQFRCYSGAATFSTSAATCSGSTEKHGTAVAETIADVAPGATLYLASPYSMLDYLAALDWMAAAGVRIVNQSGGTSALFEGPGDGTSPLPFSDYSMVDYAASKGMLWVNAAGNSGGNSWAGPFAADAANPKWHDFAPGVDTNPITLQAGDKLLAALRWQDSWSSPAADYDLVLTDSNGAEVASSKEDQPAYPYPLEHLSFTAQTSGTYQLAIWHAGGSTPPIELLAAAERMTSKLTYATATRSLVSPADSRNPAEISVGAVNVASTGTVEPYSSIGPTADGRTKPDLVAPDCGQTVTWARFCGTSQAAPHATGAAALLLARDPTLATPTALAAAMRAHTEPRGGGVDSTFGSGLLTLGPATPSASPSPSSSPGPSESPGPSGSPGPSPSAPASPPPYTSAVPAAGVTSLGSGWAGEGLATSVNGAIVHLAYQLGGQIEYRRSTDGGLTFGTPVTVGATDTTPSMPAIVATGSGLVVMTWPASDRVLTVRSTDYGTTWGSMTSVGDGPSEGPVSAAIDASGVVLVGWTDTKSHVVAVRRSIDGGASFGPPVTLGTSSSTPWQDSSLRDGSLGLAIGSGGAAYATWMATPTRLVVRRSANGGSTWSSAVVVDAATVRNTVPSISASGNRAAIAYGARTPGGSQAAVRLSLDGGAQWAARRLVPVAGYGEFEAAVLQVGSRTRLAAARCMNVGCTRVTVYFRESSNYGASWSTARAMSSTSGDSRAFVLLMGRRPLGLVVTYVADTSRLTLRRL